MTQRQNSNTAGNSTFAIGGVSCSEDSFVLAESSVFRINICGKNPAHRKCAKRYARWLLFEADRFQFRCSYFLMVS